MAWQQLLPIFISFSALFLGIFNLIITIRNHKRNSEIQIRNDRIQVDNLLDKAYECLYGKNGYWKTKEKEKFYEAESQILRAKEIDSKYSRTVEYEGVILDIEGNKVQALEKYNLALNLRPIRWNTYNNIGRLFDGEEGISYFYKAIKVNPEKAGVPYYNIGKYCLRMNEIDKAKEAFQNSLMYLPNYEYTHFELANILVKEGNISKARESFEKAISINPNYVSALVNLGTMLCEKIDWDEGISWIEAAVKIDPNDSYPLSMLAAIYADKGDHDNALKYNEKAIEMDLKRKFSSDLSHDLKKAMLKLKKSKDNIHE